MAKQTTHNKVDLKICPTQLSSKCDLAYQRKTFEDIRKAINALKNSSGGTIALRYDTSPPRGHVEKCLRKLEQKIQSFLGTIALTFDINIANTPASPRGHGEIKISVKTLTKTDGIITLHYNMYLPSAQHVNEISPSENVEKIRAILTGAIHSEEPTKPDSHHKNFVRGQSVSLSESKTNQFKNLKDKNEKKSSFATRLVSKGNKFRCYVSAYANYAGGHIYYGINDDGIVEGENLNDDEKKKVKEMIRKEIEKMEWPKTCTAADDNRWAVHFEPVKDSKDKIIPSLYVVVVFVAPCPGGVFTEAPECYEIVDNEVKKMDFATWKKRIDPSLANKETCSANAPRDLVYEKLTAILNKKCDKDSKELEAASKTMQEEYESNEHRDEVRLTCLSKFVSYHLRRGNDDEAKRNLTEYQETLSKAKNTLHFKVMEKYLLSIMERCKGNYKKSYKFAEDCMCDLKQFPHCLISAAFYVQIGTLENILATKAENCEKRNRLLTKAVENYDTANTHLNSIQGHSNTKAEFEQKICINKALLYLGSSLAGDLLPNSEGLIDIEKARHYLIKTQKIINQGYPFSHFRKIQYLFAQACLSYRMCLSNNESASRQSDLLQHAVMYTQEAQTLAQNYKFKEMMRYAENYINFFKSEQGNQCNTSA